jgi:glucose-1-phosphate cytidylyltransferase
MEETTVRPKPMVEIGGLPVLWHIMRIYASQGFDDFVVAAGYKGEAIKDYFLNYRLLHSQLHINLDTGTVDVRGDVEDHWQVQVVDTGDNTLTGGRIQRLAPHLRGEGTFMVTYGDGLADVDLEALLAFHRGHGRIATLTAVHPPVQARTLAIEGDNLTGYREPKSTARVNGGFFVFEPAIFDYLGGDGDTLEARALTQLATDGELMAYRHDGFWQCMDTPRERDLLEAMWAGQAAPWAQPAIAPTYLSTALTRR